MEAAEAAPGARAFDHTTTLPWMTVRRLERQREGTIRENKTLVPLVCVVAVTNLWLRDDAPIVTTFDASTNVTLAVLGGVAWAASRVVSHGVVLSVLVVGLLGGLMSTVVCAGQRRAAAPSAACRHHTLVGAALTLGAVVGAAAAVLARRCALGVMIARTRYVARHVDAWWRIAPDGPQRRRYAPRAPWCCLGGGGERWAAAAAECRFGYVGELNERGEPHGYGEWHDSAPHGETLRGHWERGRPVAPFRAIDITTGFTFHAVRVACVSTRSEPIDEYWYTCTRRSGGGVWSVASVECSTAGRFYRHLPRVAALETGGALRSWAECAAHAAPPADAGDAPPPPPSPDDAVVLFVHGYNCAASDAMKRMGQLWALGNFPPHLRPLVFSWPTSRALCYVRAQAMARAAAADFVSAVASVRAGGARVVHVVCHSMGVLVLTHALDALRAHVRAGGDVEGGDDARLTVRSIVLLHPDDCLAAFVDRHADAMRAICEHVTVYADRNDGALRYSAWFNGWRPIGRHPFDVRRRGDDADDDDAPPSLDVDVVDVTWMDNNVNALRHNFFDVNRLMIDDLRDILTTGRRACARSRLTRRARNVYSFMVAPRSVRN